MILQQPKQKGLSNQGTNLFNDFEIANKKDDKLKVLHWAKLQEEQKLWKGQSGCFARSNRTYLFN
ncbi:hypothetical protein TPHV1_120020 [Treponema phagedenis]|uniref:Uncharacterized protein n=1 Tax=Treponema phagedenis TaxID=162 RepID=A0A0B7GW66_TREPH|nr:hypothetical protein TPHV1_120020 [Treponema phagedenis]